MKKVVFINGGGSRVEDVFCQSAPEDFEVVCLEQGTDAAQKAAALQQADFLVLHPAAVDAELLRGAKHLKLLQLLTAGFDQIDLELCGELHLPVATNGGANAWSVAEHSLALLLGIYRRLGDGDASVRAGTWRRPIPEFTTYEIAGKTVGVLGAGNIGRRVAQRYKAFEAKLLYYDLFPSEYMEKELGAKRVSLAEIVHTADILSVHLPLFPETRGLIGAQEFALMKPQMVIINTSRAEIIEEQALTEALQQKKILAAGLDVFYEEPVRADHPLLTLENVLLSPHMAGHSTEGWTRRSVFAWQNIQRVLAVEEPLSVVRQK